MLLKMYIIYGNESQWTNTGKYRAVELGCTFVKFRNIMEGLMTNEDT